MKIIVSALLHDIGKFYQRTGKLLGNEAYLRYTKECDNLGKKYQGYIHAGYTAKFITENLNITFDEPRYLIDTSASHHIDVSGLIKTADIIASGHDRKDANREDYLLEDTEKQAEFKGSYKTKRMNAIFNEVSVEEGQKNNSSFVKLTDYENYHFESFEALPVKQVDGECEYENLFSSFCKEIDEMNKRGYHSYEELHHLIYPIIKHYTTTIPANTMSDFTTVSLFDHLKLTAAIASCIEKQTQDLPFILLDYDVSGIQDFIYKITEGDKTKEKISKSLRTRSFYLNIVADFISYYIVNQFQVSYENILSSTSGRGRILLPHIKGFEEKIVDICNQIEETLYYLHQGTLSITFSYTIIDGKELKDMNLSDLVSYDNATILNNKKQKFKNLISNPNFHFINSAYKKLCNMCMIHETKDNLCSFCQSMIELNDKIIAQKNNFVIEFAFEKNNSEGEFSLQIGQLGSIIFHLKDIEHLNHASYYVSINCHSIGETKYYARSLQPNISFSDIAKIKKNGLGDDKIAVIKMDVDNLGYIFQKGLKKLDSQKRDKETISKQLTLSRTLDYFFTKELVKICGENVYINYAGGDDLVIITPGWQSIELIRQINDAFNNYTNFNASFHISAGIDIFDSNTPVRYAIQRAEENLELSKNREGKNAFTVLGCTLHNQHLSYVVEQIEKYEKGILSNKLSRGGLYDIYSAISISLDDKKRIERYIKFIPHIAYSIERNIMDLSWKEVLKETFIMKNVKEEILYLYKVILGYTLMNTREEKEK